MPLHLVQIMISFFIRPIPEHSEHRVLVLGELLDINILLIDDSGESFTDAVGIGIDSVRTYLDFCIVKSVLFIFKFMVFTK